MDSIEEIEVNGVRRSVLGFSKSASINATGCVSGKIEMSLNSTSVQSILNSTATSGTNSVTIPVVESSTSCTSVPQIVALLAPTGECRQVTSSTTSSQSQGRTVLSALFSIDDSACKNPNNPPKARSKGWAIAVGVSLGLVALVIVAVVIIAVVSPKVRSVIMPFFKTENSSGKNAMTKRNMGGTTRATAAASAGAAAAAASSSENNSEEENEEEEEEEEMEWDDEEEEEYEEEEEFEEDAEDDSGGEAGEQTSSGDYEQDSEDDQESHHESRSDSTELADMRSPREDDNKDAPSRSEMSSEDDEAYPSRSSERAAEESGDSRFTDSPASSSSDFL